MLENGSIGSIQFEISEYLLNKLNIKPHSIIEYLKSFEYNVYEFNVTNAQFSGPIDKFNKSQGNYYASRQNLANI